MLLNPKLYEINTRIWIKQFGENARFSDIPNSAFNDLTSKGINVIYLLGIWKTAPEIIEKCCFEENLISSYNKSLKDWRKEDVIGSPFAIDSYDVNPALGKWKDLKNLKNNLNEKGIKLFLDFIPNHFSAGSKYIKTNPEYFLQADEEISSRDSYTFFKSEYESNYIFAHGRDPLFPAWIDTIQVNYFSKNAWDFMIDNLLKIAEVCDGVRCDMAMLPLTNVFHNTWLGVLNKSEIKKPSGEFWKTAIEKVKSEFPNFIFLAEAYWDLEWDLQQLGFDFTYDKRLTDRLGADDIAGIKDHLLADKSYQLKSVRFLENHDETRAVTKFGKFRSLAAAVLISTIQGMKFYFDGQFEGKKIKLPLQLGREPVEKISTTIKKYYDKLLSITKEDIFIYGDWINLQNFTSVNNDKTCNNIFAWQWKLKDELRIVVINYSDTTSRCRLKFELSEGASQVILKDLMTGEDYTRWTNEILNEGLFIALKAYQSHIFKIKNYI